MPPPEAVTVTLKLPVVAVLAALKVSVELPLPGAANELGLKLAVTPAGKPDVDRVMAELKPPAMAVEMVEVPAPPWATATLPGEALRMKSGVCAPGLKMMSSTGCNSIPFGATPVC